MRGEIKGGTHGGARRRRRHISGQPWKKSCGMPRGVDRARETHSWDQGGETGAKGKRESGDAGMDTGDGKVLGVPHAEDGDSGTDTGDTQVGGGPRAVLSVMAGL